MPEKFEHFANTKILATLGPATFDSEIIKKLILSGIDGVRLNFSHGDYHFFSQLYKNIYKACVDEKTPLSVLVDLQGPKIRIGDLSEPYFDIQEGDIIEITSDRIIGNNKKISTTYSQLPIDAKIGDIILIDDGLLRFIIFEKKENSVICQSLNSGKLKPRKGMNLPGMKLSTPSITEKDFADLKFALNHRVDYIALSFVRNPEDVVELKSWLIMNSLDIPVVAKIEKKEAIDHFDDILSVSDGIMIARGDLGVELQPQEVPVLQKAIIKKCNAHGKLVITATQMLESMINSPIPTRAEASDVANAVWDGTDVVMLSGETSVGKYPIEAVKTMNDILKKAESNYPYRKNIDYIIPDNFQEKLFDSVCRAVVEISNRVEASAIIVFTEFGRTAIRISKYNPDCKILALSNKFETMNKLSLYRNIIPIFSDKIQKEKIYIEEAKKKIIDLGYVKTGDLLIFTSGTPISEKGRINWLDFEIV